jgi:hypothetical protein
MHKGPTPPNWQPPPPDRSSRALKLSGAALIWVIIGVIALCVGGPILCCMGGMIGGFSGHPAVTSGP